MSKDKPQPTPQTHPKRVPLLSNGLPEVFMPDWMMRGAASVRIDPAAADTRNQRPASND